LGETVGQIGFQEMFRFLHDGFGDDFGPEQGVAFEFRGKRGTPGAEFAAEAGCSRGL
jgi:hypothetical protein